MRRPKLISAESFVIFFDLDLKTVYFKVIFYHKEIFNILYRLLTVEVDGCHDFWYVISISLRAIHDCKITLMRL